MKKIALNIFILLLLIMCSKPSFALGKLGHQLVCQLAFEHLPFNQQQKITTLLNAIPLEHQQAINNYNNQNKNQVMSFSNACTWADAIKSDSSFDRYKSWHYINVPRTQKAIKGEVCDKNCLPQAVIFHQRQLQKSKEPWEKAQALLFLGHWLGDLHQPLHVSFSDDWGGNKIKFKHNKSECNNMHWFWDDCIIKQTKRSKAQWLTTLNRQWDNLTVPSWKAEQVWQWANESYQLAKQANVQYCKNVIINKEKVCQAPEQYTVDLAYDYQQVHAKTIEFKMLQAAKRLMTVLKKSL